MRHGVDFKADIIRRRSSTFKDYSVSLVLSCGELVDDGVVMACCWLQCVPSYVARLSFAHSQISAPSTHTRGETDILSVRRGFGGIPRTCTWLMIPVSVCRGFPILLNGLVFSFSSRRRGVGAHYNQRIFKYTALITAGSHSSCKLGDYDKQHRISPSLFLQEK